MPGIPRAGRAGMTLFLLAATAGLPANLESQYNVAQGKTVTASGTFGTGNDGWPYNSPAPFGSLVDGIFRPEGTMWTDGTVWWNHTQNVSLQIDLGGVFDIFSFTVQADNNDGYTLEYRTSPSGAWLTAWTVPAISGWGMMTRMTTLATPITASDLRFTSLQYHDNYKAVSEIQAMGTNTVPEPMSMVLLGTGLAGIAGAARRRNRHRTNGGDVTPGS